MDAVLDMKDPDSGRSLYARRASDENILIGKRLTAELVELTSLIASGNIERILASAPADLVEWFQTHGYDPTKEWINSRLTNIILNYGHTVDWQ